MGKHELHLFLDLLLLPLYPEVQLKCDNYSFLQLHLL